VNGTVDLHSSDVPSSEQTNYKWDFKSCCVLQDDYGDERNKTVFHNITPDLHDQDQAMTTLCKTKTKLVSDHITDKYRRTPNRGAPELRSFRVGGVADPKIHAPPPYVAERGRSDVFPPTRPSVDSAMTSHVQDSWLAGYDAPT